MNASPFIDKLETLSLREKLLIACTVAALIVSLLQFLLIDPTLASGERLEGQMRSLTSNNKRLSSQLEGKSLMPNHNRQLVLNKEVATLEADVETQDALIRAQTASLVPARQVNALLQSLLSKDTVELVGMKNIAPVPILEEEITPQHAGMQLYRHGIELTLRGSYHDLRRYLVTIEGQSWKVLWHGVHLETETDGKSVMRLELQTLSTDNAWLGV